MNLKQAFEKIIKFEYNATPEDFQACFGENLGNHLWDKFRNKYKHSISGLYTVLDSECRDKLANYIENIENNKKSADVIEWYNLLEDDVRAEIEEKYLNETGDNQNLYESSNFPEIFVIWLTGYRNREN